MTVTVPRLRAGLPLFPALLVLVVWFPSLGASFQFDDWAVIVGDPRVQSLQAWWHSMPGMRPLLKLSFALNHALGAGPGGFRALNIGLHALNASLVFVLLQRLARRLRVADEAGALCLAALATLLFALHPVQTESVTYVSGRSTVLMASCVLLSLLAATWRRNGTTPWTLHALALLLLGAALAAKETAAVTPLALALCLVGEHGRRLMPTFAPVLAQGLLVALLLAAGLLFLPYDFLLATSLATRDPLTNLLVQVQGIGWLVGQLLPFAALNADPALPAVIPWDIETLCTGLALVACGVLGLWSLRRKPALAFGILWFYLWLAPTNSLLARLDVANDRQLYLAIIGPAWLLGLGLLRLQAWTRRLLPSAVFGVIAIGGILLSTGTLLRNTVYETEVSFWQDVLATAPQNARAANNLGLAHALACEPLAAAAAFERAIALTPQDPLPQVNLALLRQGELPGIPNRPECH